MGDLIFSSAAAAALPVNSFNYVNKNKSFPPVQRKQQQKYTENKGKGLQWNDFLDWRKCPTVKKQINSFSGFVVVFLNKPYDDSTIRGAAS